LVEKPKLTWNEVLWLNFLEVQRNLTM
jgi:hypothetical protein